LCARVHSDLRKHHVHISFCALFILCCFVVVVVVVKFCHILLETQRLTQEEKEKGVVGDKQRLVFFWRL